MESEKLSRAMYAFQRAVHVLVDLEAMKIANVQAIMNNETPPYGENQFSALKETLYY